MNFASPLIVGWGKNVHGANPWVAGLAVSRTLESPCIRMNQARIEQKGGADKSPPPTLHEDAVRHPAMAEREWLRGPLSRETSYRLIVSGDLEPKEIGKLIKLLKVQRAVLSNDDDGQDDEAAN